ncbi:DNA polymerase III subunit alpha [Microbacterium sp. EYE_5]|uniref:DNA polymerase III subunit alpha n=1 Tax=unclassified Microbacterium TaxID=2609290 RepID=UPI0027E06493|nr:MULTISPECIES: DNA polymerase III subunit alpha [unclassified Microbacterium]MCK6080459.1 DNA polymerase III subunit alpha [Microbacterium sp. EYE_382]MCK6085730.1 DNA polymerase III subunit alpha [Microbacterium sp. EYE_384]MCK6124772.1 DNA polymerase III subunit alpha [Microbacterium sp. EYE_80]MCK6127681.1 DNA polymerase III subunit alpha [Microbacterium sp. EYE_79]MCK6141414.1 DNA polymerase III subunit alpha [Microbacterium sp. EYE_39]
MASDSFVHLHVHSEYSMLDGAAKIGAMTQAAAEYGMPAIAVTDHGNTFAAFEFYRAAKAAGVKPIVGLEAYVTPGTHRSDKSRVAWGSPDQKSDDVSGSGAYTHMTMWSQSTEGMHNLFRLSSLSSIEGYYFKPRMDRELLQTYGKGLIATTGCPSGEVQTRLRLGQYEAARAAAAEFQDIFGKENYFAEIMDHGLSIERRVMTDLIRLSKDLDIPLVATNDSHYTHQHEADAHEALLCVQSGSTLDDPNRFKFDGDGYYIKTAQEMRQMFRDHPEACDNTLLIAERCEVEFNTSANYMPRFPVPDGETEDSWLIKEVEAGLHYRYPGGIPDRVRKQAEYETGIILQMGFPGYFLVVADFINWAKDNGIRVGPGRGSGAGSMVAYAMRITDLDPLEHGLIFERFLNPDRVSMPDFDVDFDDRRRGEVIDYVTEKYGSERVAQIVTYGTIKSKQALKDAGRVLGFPFSMGERLTKAMPPPVMGKDMELGGMFDAKHPRYKEASEFRSLIDTDPEAKTVFDRALGLEGLKRQWGVHAAGVIMSSEPLIDIIPIMRREQDGQIVTQFDYPSCETLGLIKMDFLGLRNLTIISDALDNIRTNRGEELDLEHLELEDRAAYDLLSRGDTLGVFQLDGGPMRSLLRLMKPDNFEDISAVIALYRPGPMGANSHTNYALRKNGVQPITPIHPELEEPLRDILDTTYGLIIYQEQVMAIAQKVAGFSLGQADILRRAMGKKKKSELDKQYEGFSGGMKERGFGEAAIKALWDILLPFSDYAFNKAHSAAYGLVSYWTAYLKAHYPAEYMAALLTSVGDSKDKMAVYLNECRRMGIRVLPPDVGESIRFFAAVGEDIRFGLGAVRNVGTNVVDGIVSARADGPYTSFHDFLTKVPVHVANKRTVESLIKAGAFDTLGATRRALVEIHEDAVEQAVLDKRREANGEVGFDFDSLWGDDEPQQVARVPERPEWTKKDKLAFEREMLGLYVSDHPLAGLEIPLAKHASTSIHDLLVSEDISDGDIVTVAGLVTSVQHRVAKQSGNPYGMITVEDFDGEVTVMFMGKTYTEFQSMLQADSILVVRGRVSQRDDGRNLHGQSAFSPDLGSTDAAGPLVLLLPEHRATETTIGELAAVFGRHPGSTEVTLKLHKGGSAKVFEVPAQVGVTVDLYGELKGLLGPQCLG